MTEHPNPNPQLGPFPTPPPPGAEPIRAQSS